MRFKLFSIEEAIEALTWLVNNGYAVSISNSHHGVTLDVPGMVQGAAVVKRFDLWLQQQRIGCNASDLI